MINAFAFTHSFTKGNPREVISDLQSHGFTGINLAMNYHGSRDFLLRQGPQLEYLKDGFHYYLPNPDHYPQGALVPHKEDHLGDDTLLKSVFSSADEMGFEVNAWAVYLHNSAIGLGIQMQPSPMSTAIIFYLNSVLAIPTFEATS